MGEGRPEPGEAVAPAPGRAGGIGLTLIAGLLLAVVVAATLVVRSATDSDQSARPDGTAVPRAVTPSVTETVADRASALKALLDSRSRALLARDPVSWSATVDPAVPEFAGRQAAVFQNLSQVPLRAWDYELAGNGPSLSAARLAELAADDAWVSRVVLDYQLQDAGSAPVRREQYLTVVQRQGQWLLAGDRDGPTAVDLWDLGPVRIAHSGRSVLIGTADQAVLDDLAGPVDRAAARVDEVWGEGWPRTMVVMIPQDQAQMAALLGRDSASGLDQIAAVTTGEIGLDTAATSADRIIINPEAFAKLGPLGREVVLSHEITHVATRATTTTAVPIWLSEGFADYVGYTGTKLATEQIARDVISVARKGDAPTALPDSADFDPVKGDIAPAYAAAWLAVHLVAERYGEPVLIEFYRAVADGDGRSTSTPASVPGTATASQASVDAAFASVLGTDQGSFTAGWRAEIDRLAASAPP